MIPVDCRCCARFRCYAFVDFAARLIARLIAFTLVDFVTVADLHAFDLLPFSVTRILAFRVVVWNTTYVLLPVDSRTHTLRTFTFATVTVAFYVVTITRTFDFTVDWVATHVAPLIAILRVYVWLRYIAFVALLLLICGCLRFGYICYVVCC